jgi:hypothetical protein
MTFKFVCGTEKNVQNTEGGRKMIYPTLFSPTPSSVVPPYHKTIEQTKY